APQSMVDAASSFTSSSIAAPLGRDERGRSGGAGRKFIMQATLRGKRWMVRLMLALPLTAASGCLSFLHPVAPPTPPGLDLCSKASPECRHHVYIFLINGLDPLRVGNLAGVRDHLQALGFVNTYYGELVSWSWFKREVIRVHQEDRGGRIVLVGYSAGGSMAYRLANAVKEEGV